MGDDQPDDAHVFKQAGETHCLDRTSLAAHLAAAGLTLDRDAPIEQFATGLANINYRLSIDGRPFVLRRPPDGDLPPGAHDMGREHRILSRLHEALPLAPRSLHFCDDPKVIGVPFQIIEYRPGLVIKGDDRTHLEHRPERCAALAQMLVDILVAIHKINPARVGLEALGKPDGFILRAIRGWRGRAERLEPSGATATLITELGEWLDRQPIAPRAPALLHCDLKLDNVILDPATFAPRAVIDWDMGTRGDPLFDLATMLSYWTEPDDPPCMHELRQMPTAAQGFPSRGEIVAAYAKATGIDVSDYPAIRVLAMFKLAIVFMQLHALRGGGPDADPLYATFAGLADGLLAFAHDVARGRA
ncbi:MAG: phosphotransferase family protein [Hyphomicrobiaceae bacterium]|nr:phosphotransferase family protein [Hyphomicrobiaceae bacterium]